MYLAYTSLNVVQIESTKSTNTSTEQKAVRVLAKAKQIHKTREPHVVSKLKSLSLSLSLIRSVCVRWLSMADAANALATATTSTTTSTKAILICIPDARRAESAVPNANENPRQARPTMMMKVGVVVCATSVYVCVFGSIKRKPKTNLKLPEL